MAKRNHQKLKLLYLAQMLLEQTDDKHGLTAAQIIDQLARLDITADRKTLYNDLDALREFGLDIIGAKDGASFRYAIANRNFELAELKLLVDSVLAAKFITEKKSRALIKKLEALASIHDAKELHRQVYISGRVKTMNESIYYNVDKIHTAINTNVQIRFQYFQWNVDKEQELRHNGAWYQVSPWTMLWDDEYYYLVAYDAKSGILKHYRVDKMLRIALTDNVREGRQHVAAVDMAAYSKSLFGMFGGQKITVTLAAENRFAGILIDRFGKEIAITKIDNDHFQAKADVVASDSFISWVLSLGSGIQIIAPESVLESARKMLLQCYAVYFP